MGVDARYDITSIHSEESYDRDFFFYKLFRIAPEAKGYLDDEGTHSGNEGYWKDFEEDMCKVTLEFPFLTIDVKVVEEYDGTTESRYKFHNGKYQMIEPIMTWPDFDGNWKTP